MDLKKSLYDVLNTFLDMPYRLRSNEKVQKKVCILFTSILYSTDRTVFINYKILRSKGL